MSQDILELKERLNQLELKIQNLNQKHQALIDYIVKSPQFSATSNSSVPKSEPTASRYSSPQQSIPTTPPYPPPVTSSALSSISLLPIVGVICFVLAGVFIVRLAIETGWLTGERQLTLLTVMGAGFVAIGRYLKGVDSHYRSYLSATGIITLYMAAYSSSLYFNILSPGLSMVGAMGISVLCMSLFLYHRSEIFPIITSVGAYLSPLLLGAKQDLIFHAGFFILWASVFSAVSTYFKTRTLTLVSSYLGLGVFTLLHARIQGAADLGTVIFVQITQFVIFAYGVFHYSIQNNEALKKSMALAYLPVLLFFYGTTYYFLDKLSPGLAPWLSLSFAGLIYFLYQKARSQIQNLESQTLVHGFLSVVFFHSGYLQILPATSKPWLLPTILLFGYISERKNLYPRLSPLLKGFFYLIGVIEFFSITFSLLTKNDTSSLLPAFVTLFVGGFAYLKGTKWVREKSHVFLGVLHLLTILALYRLMHDWGSFAVSLSWGLYSFTILGVGYRSRDKILSQSSLLVLLVSSLKALIYDASQSPSSVRILSLLLTGAVLYGAGILFKKIQQWN